MNENSNSNLWVFYQKGGGWCYDESSCKKRITNNLAIGIVNDLISSKLWPPVQYNMKGIFQTFPDANLVNYSKLVVVHFDKRVKLSNVGSYFYNQRNNFIFRFTFPTVQAMLT